MQVEQAPQPTKKPRALWKIAVNLGLVALLIGVFAWQIHKSWPALSSHSWNVQWGLAALAMLFLMLTPLLDVLIWNRALGWFTDPLPFRQALPIYTWSYIARYIPGKVVSLVLRVTLAKEVGREPVPVLAASAVELALRNASASLLFLISLIGWGIPMKGGVWIAAVILIALALICSHPRIMLPIINFGLKKLKQSQITRPLRYREILLVFSALFMRWIVYGISFAIFAASVYPQAWANIPVLIGTAGGAWAVGFFSMTPGGAGATEIVLKEILERSLSFPTVIAIALPVLFRLVTLLCEALWSLASLFARLSWRRNTEPSVEVPV